MTYKQMQLIRRTAWMNLQILDRGPSEADAKYVPIAVRMLTMVACMGYAVLDLEAALADAGKLRHQVKLRMVQMLPTNGGLYRAEDFEAVRTPQGFRWRIRTPRECTT